VSSPRDANTVILTMPQQPPRVSGKFVVC
jgi:hypothetical protein